jgi:hypothetical protein
MDRDIRTGITHVLISLLGDIYGLYHHKGLEVGPSENVERIFQHLAQNAEKYASHSCIQKSG